ncbi:DUF6414 family protein [Micromonospora chersina]
MLREFMYVDTDKVRSILAQLDGGVAEELNVTTKNQGKLAGGIKSIASREQMWGGEESTQRSLADAIFPTLEDALESEGYLADISDRLSGIDNAAFKELQEEFPPGSFVRITAPSRLFDARYMARAFGGFSVAARGVESIRDGGSPKTPPKQRGGRQSKAAEEARADALESAIYDYAPDITGGFDATQLRAFIQVARGLFLPGLHVVMALDDDSLSGLTVTARLQEGHRYLESEPDVLFSRYGMEGQDWTVVGTIGSYSPPEDFEVPEMIFNKPDGTVSRRAFVEKLNGFLALLGVLGFADHPQYPGLSIVPFAVYRPILPISHEARTVQLEASPS